MRVISFKKVKTRKSHQCWGCTKEIPIGIEVDRTINIDGNSIGTAYWCPQCAVLWGKLSMEDQSDVFTFGEFAQYCKDTGLAPLMGRGNEKV